MWKTLRRFQGEDYEPRERVQLPNVSESKWHPNTTCQSRCALTQRSLSLHETKAYPKPQDPFFLSTPYSGMVYQKIAVNLIHDNTVLRRQAMRNLLDLFLQKGEHVVNAIHVDIGKVLLSTLVDMDDEMRAQTCMAFELLVRQVRGQEYILRGSQGTNVGENKTGKDNSCQEEEDNNSYLVHFLRAAQDDNNDVVVEALRLLSSVHHAHNEYEATKQLISIGCVKVYVEKLSSHDDSVCSVACHALSKIFDVKEAFIIALDAGAMEAVTELLSTRKDAAVLTEAAEVVTKLVYFGAGKRAAVKNNTIAAVVQHIQNQEVTVRTSISGAVAALTLEEQGKSQALQCDILSILQNALAMEDERDALINHVKTVCNLTELPTARHQLRSSIVQRLEEILSLSQEHGALTHSVHKALEMIAWNPGSAE